MPEPRDPANVEPASREIVLARMLDLLAREHVMTLACRDAQGTWVAAVFYASDRLDLYFVSSPTSRHARSLAFDARLAAEVHGPAADWHAIVGLQISGTVEEIHGAEAAAARCLYAGRFPFIDGAGSTPDPALARALEKVAWYRLRIDDAVLIDNTRGLGRRASWSRADG